MYRCWADGLLLSFLYGGVAEMKGGCIGGEQKERVG